MLNPKFFLNVNLFFGPPNLTQFSRTYAGLKKNNFSMFPWHKLPASKECQHYISYLGAGEKILAKYCLVRPRYRGAHFYSTRLSLIYSGLEKIDFLMSRWYELPAREECHRYIGNLGVGEKILAEFCTVRPQYRGAYFYLTRLSRIYACFKKNNFFMFPWHELPAREVCHLYIGYLGVGEKNLAEYCTVRPQYRGAHFYLTRLSRIYDCSKKINFFVFQLHKLPAREVCHPYIGYLGVREKILAKYCTVRPRYRGAHPYQALISRLYACLEKYNFLKFPLHEHLARKECHHYIVYLGAGEKTFAKCCMVCPQYRGARYHLFGSGFGREYTRWKKISFSTHLWCESYYFKECQHYICYLGAGEKIFVKYFMVCPHYRGADYYLVGIGIGREYTGSKKIFFSKYPWFELSYLKECQHCRGLPATGTKFFVKNCLARHRFHGAHYHRLGTGNRTVPAKLIIIIVSKFQSMANLTLIIVRTPPGVTTSLNKKMVYCLPQPSLGSHRLYGYDNFREKRYCLLLPLSPPAGRPPTYRSQNTAAIQVTVPNFCGRG